MAGLAAPELLRFARMPKSDLVDRAIRGRARHDALTSTPVAVRQSYAREEVFQSVMIAAGRELLFLVFQNHRRPACSAHGGR
jgi:hypothetical protein